MGAARNANNAMTPPRPDTSIGGTDYPELMGAAPLDVLKVDELSDKLIEKREKLEYFIVTAATGVIVFSFNDFAKQQGLLRGSRVWLVGLSWAVLLLASGSALYALRWRHGLYSINQDMRYGLRTAPSEQEAKQIKRGNWMIKTADRAMGVLFVVGMACLAVAYAIALSKGT